MAPLPFIKLGAVLFKELSKPLAAEIKRRSQGTCGLRVATRQGGLPRCAARGLRHTPVVLPSAPDRRAEHAKFKRVTIVLGRAWETVTQRAEGFVRGQRLKEVRPTATAPAAAAAAAAAMAVVCARHAPRRCSPPRRSNP